METSKTEIKVFLLYASETGNCEQISEDLAASLTQKFSGGFPEIFRLKRSKLNEFTTLGIEKKDCLKVVVIITSSTGDGDSPENGELFHRFLRREAAKGSSKAFSHIFWTLLGLGSSDYSKFQGAPRFVANKMN
jgi:methionine synthase reductase